MADLDNYKVFKKPIILTEEIMNKKQLYGKISTSLCKDDKKPLKTENVSKRIFTTSHVYVVKIKELLVFC